MDSPYQNYTKGNVDFMSSRTRENLMRAFAGESQARNRYTFAAGVARKEQLEVIARVFEFTADQERAHAKVFLDLLGNCAGQTIKIDGTYPVDVTDSALTCLRAAQHNECQEWQEVYAGFARTAREEGFDLIGHQFELIAEIEKTHGERFGLFADLLEQGKLFAEEDERAWVCLNCGKIVRAAAAPQVCPVCRHSQGYYVRLEMAPYTAEG